MASFKERFVKYRKTNLITLLVSIVVGGLFFLLFFFTGSKDLMAATNAATLSGGILFASGVLVWVANEGLFDMLTYGFRQMGHSIFNRNNPAKYNDFPDYKEKKYAKRSDSPDVYLPIMVAGLLFLIAMIPLRICLAVAVGA